MIVLIFLLWLVIFHWHYKINKKTKGVIPFVFFYLLSLPITSQEISSKLDSIFNIKVENQNRGKLYEDLIQYHKNTLNYSQVGNDAHEIAKWFHKRKDSAKTLEYIQIAIDARKKAKPFNPEFLQRSMYNLGYYYKKYKGYPKAILSFRKMIAVEPPIKLHGRAYRNIAECYELIGDPYQALDNYLNAFQVLDPQKEAYRILINHIDTGFAYRGLRNKENGIKAIQHFMKADSILKQGNEPDFYNSYAIYNNLGGQYFEQTDQDIDKALFYFQKALIEAEKINEDYYLSQIHLNLGIANTKINDKLAKQHFKQSLQYKTTSKTIQPSVYLGLGSVAYEEKKYEVAIRLYQQSLSYFLGTEIKNNEWQPNKELLTYVENKSLVLELLKRKIKAWLAYGQSNNSKHSFNTAIQTTMSADLLIDLMLEDNLSFRSKLLWRSLVSEIYVLGLEACLKVNDLEKALYFIEKNKALLLMHEIGKKKISIPEAILEQEKKLENKIRKLQKSYQNATQAQKDSLSQILLSQKNSLQQFKDSLSTGYSRYFSSTAIPRIVSQSDLKLNDNEAIVNYIMAEKIHGELPDAYGMIITNQQKLLFKIDNIPDFLDDIKSLREKLNHPFKTSENIQQYKKVAYNLYNSLFPKEIQNELTNKKVTIITDHILGFIPFEALVTDIDSGRYLIEDCEINYAYSLSFQKENQNISRNARFDFLGVAPVQFKDDLPTLSKSENEIKIANSYYNGSLLLKDKATIANFKEQAAQYKILHLATHANASDSIAPWIAFRNKKLSHYELNTIENTADLVVLSACNTSIGEVRRGEGVMSLARGFFKSGAKTVIPSLWNTNDKTTTHIISDFYRNLSQGKTKSEALRMAKLNYLKSNSDAEASPYYWAPLILIGDTGVLLPQSNSTLFLYLGLAIFSILVLVIIRRIKLLSYRS